MSPVGLAGSTRALGVGLVVFLANAGVLVLQLVAGRLLAPSIGVALETWTAIIGVFLTGISLGNWLGGRLADRSHNGRTLGLLLMAGAACTYAALFSSRMLPGVAFIHALPLHIRIAVLCALVCLPSSFVLSMITPVAIRLLLLDVRRTGRVVGLVYALGTVGSLLGNFLTGYVLLARYGTGSIVTGIAIALFVLGAMAVGSRWKSRTSTVEETPEARTSDIAASAQLTPLTACAVVFVTSFCSMSLEIAAGRLLAPEIGVSLYSWTGIIGVVLVGIAAGNYRGGLLADTSPDRALLGRYLFLGGLATMFVVVFFGLLSGPGGVPAIAGRHLGLIAQIVTWVAILFLIPMYFLATVSPQTTRLAVPNVTHAGRVAGRIYAWSCAGAILGTFVTGWGGLALLGVHKTIIAVSLVLLGLSVAVGQPWLRPTRLKRGGAVVLVSFASVVLLEWAGARLGPGEYLLESNYYTIRVSPSRYQDQNVMVLILDHLIHSYVKGEMQKQPSGAQVFVADASFLGYPHETVQAELARYAVGTSPDAHLLIIGGGGYTLPRWLEANLPTARTEVVEIDPGVTQAVYDALGFPRTTKVITHNCDARQFVQEQATKGSYQLIVQDAVNDLSVPYHIMTKEYDDAIKELLAPNGVYLLTVIDDLEDGQLMRAAVRTLQQTFPNVALLDGSKSGIKSRRRVWVIYGSMVAFQPEHLRAALQTQSVETMLTQVMPSAEFDRYMAGGSQLVLTDAYAPVDNLISAVFRTRDTSTH
jgi:MFS family permease